MSSDKEDKVERKKEEFNLSLRFMKALERKMEQIEIREGSKNIMDFQLDEPERNALYAINNTGLLQGTAAGILSFIVLRRIRSAFINRLRTQPTSSTTTTTHAVNSNTIKNPFTGTTKHSSPFQQQKPPTSTGTTNTATTPPPIPPVQQVTQGMSERRTPGTLFNVLTILIDGTISFYIAVFVSIREPEKILQKLAALPLIEGKSVIANEFCPEFLHELHNIQKEIEQSGRIQQKDALINPQTPPLKALLQFCTNCKQRAVYEKLLRQQRGLNDNDPISIPSPGVPQNQLGDLSPSSNNNNNNITDFDDNNIDDNHWQQQNSSSITDFYDPSNESSSNNNDWAEGFVTDKEEQEKREKERK